MGYDVTNFTDYVARASEFLTAILFRKGDVSKFARQMSGIKNKEKVPHIDGEAILQTGTCVDPSGDTTITEIDIEVIPWTYYEGFCTDDLQKKFPPSMLKKGSNSMGDTPANWEETVVDVKMSSINKTLELTYWRGDTDGTYDMFDGWIKRIDADGNAIVGNTSEAQEITLDNVIQLIDDMVEVTPVDVQDDEEFVVLCGRDIFRRYIAATKKANLFNYTADNKDSEYFIGGTNALLMAQRGLSGTDRMFASVGRNFITGMDVKDEENIIDIWWEKKDDKVYFRTKAKTGVSEANISQIVEFTLDAGQEQG